MTELKKTGDLRFWPKDNTKSESPKRRKFIRPKKKYSREEMTKLLKNKSGGKIMYGYKAGGKV
jgi:hypothetical protein